MTWGQSVTGGCDFGLERGGVEYRVYISVSNTE